MFRFHLLFALFFAWGISQAQDSSSLHLNAGVLYNSGLNYFGRVDSLHSKGICPFVGISLKNGLYINSTFVFVKNALQSEYAATLLEAGYNFGGPGKSWAGNLSASRFFYQQDIGLVESAVKEMVSGSLTQLNKVANVTLTTSFRWSNRIDYNVQGGLDHLIRIPGVLSKNGVLVIDPTATISAGTQNFTTTYYQEKRFLLLPAEEQEVTTNSTRFAVLATEFSCPIVYGLGKTKWMLTPAYVIPQNLLIGSETGSNLFYITAMVKITL